MNEAYQPVQAMSVAMRIRRIALLFLAGLAIGSLVALASSGLLWAIGKLHVSLHAPLSAIDSAFWSAVAFVAIPVLGGLLVTLILTGMYHRRAHALAEIIEAVQTGETRVQAGPGLRSTLASVIAMGSGASVGEYGPLAHFGGVIGARLSALIRAGYWNTSTGIACGVAAAISATFNAPIAGILFVHEVVLRHFAVSSFAPVAGASIVAWLVADALAVREPLLLVEDAMVGHYWEYALFVLIGAVGAVAAVGYMRGILRVEALAGRLRIPLALRPAAAGLAVGVTALWIPEILGVGHDTLRAAIIEGRFTLDALGVVFIAKLAASILCLGMGFAGGVFGPALVSGALFGALCGSLTIALIGEPHASLTVYGICGMVALASPVIGAPLASVLIVFELTHNYTATIAALASVAIANLIAYRFFGRSLFDVQLGRKGLDLSTGRSKARLAGATLHRLISDEYLSVERDLPIDQVLREMSLGGFTEACICERIDNETRFAGVVTLADAYRTRLDDDKAVAGDAMRQDWPVLNAGTTVWQAMDYLRTFTGQAVPVVESPDKPRLLGIVTEQALISAYLETMERVHREEHGTQ